MNSCDHISWLHICGRNDVIIHHGDRVARVFQDLTDVRAQYPSVVCFLGRKQKLIAMREIFPHNNFRRSHRAGFVNLRLDSATLKSDFPLLLLDSDPLSPMPQSISSPACHGEEILPTTWPAEWGHRAKTTFYGRLVFLFCDVICIFAEDFGGLTEVAEFLRSCFQIRSASSLPERVRPRVIIVVKEETDSVTHSFLDLEDLRFSLQQESSMRRNEVFASIKLIRLAGSHLSALARYRRLKEVILRDADMARAMRVEERLLFCAEHLQGFLHLAIHHTAASVTEPFNFIVRSRSGNEVRQDFETHLCVFLTLAKRYALSFSTSTVFIASSIVMDAYPYRMHGQYLSVPMFCRRRFYS